VGDAAPSMMFEVDEHTCGGTTDVYRIIPADVPTSRYRIFICSLVCRVRLVAVFAQ